jgi:pimeloyl-ACP methyl ester carboxylesterase
LLGGGWRFGICAAPKLGFRERSGTRDGRRNSRTASAQATKRSLSKKEQNVKPSDRLEPDPPTKGETMSTDTKATADIRPFRLVIPGEKLDELRQRIGATRWPSKELVGDRSQGVQLETLQALARYWLDEYESGRMEARLNALPQFVTEIDGVDVHFIHVKSAHENALPLIMTHGWPGSVIELIDSIGPLTDPTAHGGRAEDAFHLVLPSLPGYGLSGEPVEIGWDLGRTARAWAALMPRLGYTRYVAQGGDVGAGVTDAMSRQAPEGLIGIHTNLLVPALNGPMPTDTDDERAAAAQIATFGKSGNGYFVEMATRPQTIGYALLDSPVALAAWMIDHDTDAYYKIATAFGGGQPSGNLTRDHILDNITLYWLTGTGASAARSYWEAYGPDAPAASLQPLPATAIPFGFTTFPGEIWRTPRSWVEASYPNVIYFNAVDKGGHFAAWEEPELFSTEIRAAFSSLR